jgi:hypothetical protein
LALPGRALGVMTVGEGSRGDAAAEVGLAAAALAARVGRAEEEVVGLVAVVVGLPEAGREPAAGGFFWDGPPL